MNRRRALQQLSLLTASTFLPAISIGKDNTLPYGISGAQVYSNGQLEEYFVGITAEGQIRLSKEALPVGQLIEAQGKVLSAGFIDILGDNSASPEQTYGIFEKYKLADGLSTVLQMHGGSGNPKQYYQHFGKLPHYVNYGVSTKVMIIRLSYNTLAARLQAVRESVEAGALGVSHSIEYQPTPYEEVLAYAKIAARYQVPFCLHLRYSSKERELEGVREAVKIARASGAHVHIAHLHSTGGTFAMQQALDILHTARAQGLSMSTCIYPYTYWATYLHSKRFDEGWQQMYGLSYADLTVVGTGEKLSKVRFEQLRRQPGILVAVPEGTMPFDKTIDLALQTDFCMIGSDGGIEREPRANSHPRGAGCFATAMAHGLKIGISLEKMLDKVTRLPANLLAPALSRRGDIQEGYIADLTLFDSKTIQGKATVSNPNVFSEGIEAVFIQGKLAYRNKKILMQAGRAIRR